MNEPSAATTIKLCVAALAEAEGIPNELELSFRVRVFLGTASALWHGTLKQIELKILARLCIAFQCMPDAFFWINGKPAMSLEDARKAAVEQQIDWEKPITIKVKVQGIVREAKPPINNEIAFGFATRTHRASATGIWSGDVQRIALNTVARICDQFKVSPGAFLVVVQDQTNQ